MRLLSDFLPLVLPSAPGCPEPIAEQAIRQAAIEFCERTKLWRSKDKYQATTQDDIAAPCEAVVLKVEDARFDGRRLEPIAVTDLNDRYDDMDWNEIEGGMPTYITQYNPNTLKIVPSGEGMVTLTLLLKPSQDAEELPDFLYEEHARIIADGALAEILMIPGQPYTNGELAGVRLTRFNGKIQELQVRNITGQQGAPVRTKPSYF